MRVLAISGSLRRDSHNTRLLRVAAALAPPLAELELFGGLKEVPPTTRTTTATLHPKALGACARRSPPPTRS